MVLVWGGLDVEALEPPLDEELLVELEVEPASARNTGASLELAEASDAADPPDEPESSNKQPVNAKHNAVAIAKLMGLRAIECVVLIDLTWDNLRIFAAIDSYPRHVMLSAAYAVLSGRASDRSYCCSRTRAHCKRQTAHSSS